MKIQLFKVYFFLKYKCKTTRARKKSENSKRLTRQDSGVRSIWTYLTASPCARERDRDREDKIFVVIVVTGSGVAARCKVKPPRETPVGLFRHTEGHSTVLSRRDSQLVCWHLRQYWVTLVRAA